MSCCFKKTTKVSAVQGAASSVEYSKEKRDKLYYDFLAPSVHHLETTLLDEIKSSGLDVDTATIYDLENLRDSVNFGVIRSKGTDIVCPIDGKLGAAYVHCIGKGDDSSMVVEEHVGTANFMLSYAWGYKYIDIVDTLTSFCDDQSLDPKKTFVWICAFCNNQHRIGTQGVVAFETFQEIFQQRVKGIQHVLAMMTPWNDPGYLKRVWCIFEAYNAYADDHCTLKIIMPPRDEDSLIQAVMKPADGGGRNGLDDLFDVLANTKVESAEATSRLDKENILRLVEEGPGAHELNLEINNLLRTWIRDTVVDAARAKEELMDDTSNSEGTDNYTRREIATFLTFCASFFSRVSAHQEALDLHRKGLEIYETLEDKEDAKELMARCYNNMGTELESMAKYEEALEMHTKCREAFEDIYGNEHPNTSVSYFNIGAVYGKLERTEEALAMYKKSLEIDKKVHGENHIDVASSYTYIGRVLQKTEDYDGALEMFKNSLAIRENTYGKNHPDTAIGYGDLGLLYHMRGEYDDAINIHSKAVAINEKSVGKYHADTASAYQNLGGAHYEKGEYKKALVLVKKAKKAYESSLGANHPKTSTSSQWVTLVEEEMFNQQMQQ